MTKISIMGTGYVGLTMGVGLAFFGWDVLCLDIDKQKIECLQQGKLPLYEPRMKEVLLEQIKADRIRFSNDLEEGIKWADVIFLAVGTPIDYRGDVDRSALFSAVRTIGENLVGYKLIVTKSTVPVGTNQEIKELLHACGNDYDAYDVVSNPEFFREGHALDDFYQPSRIILGTDNERSLEIMYALYRPFEQQGVPFVVTDFQTAELVKYASNSFLAMKVAFINEMARLCDGLAADVGTLAYAMGLDDRIGGKHLQPGPGFGGSCLPKDTTALSSMAGDKSISLPLVEATLYSNNLQKEYLVNRIGESYPSLENVELAVLGVAFKAGTDDVRDSTAMDVINMLLEVGVRVRIYDPQAMEHARKLWQDRVAYGNNLEDTIQHADGVVILTDWNEFREMDLASVRGRMKAPYLFDFRNLFERKTAESEGFVYIGLGK
ncbi:UDP-glucose dehydrogenase family protein [Brevibacillus ginsengisoli]|uniref:UDP-glucose dehydrogenase family protein n=1 Tax=Brevibacillus ginsengisoli TaxID=363854 RepID=UPI003CE8BEDE